jgi:hypothetical protein
MRASRRELTASFGRGGRERSWLHDEPVGARIESDDADVRHGNAVHFPNCHLAIVVLELVRQVRLAKGGDQGRFRALFTMPSRRGETPVLTLHWSVVGLVLGP